LQDKDEISYDFSVDFQVESYLKHQGESFVKRFDANSYLFITKAVDLFDLSRNDSLIDGFKDIECKVKVISVDSDWLYPTEQSTELVTALNANDIEVSFSEIKSNYGHDAFLLEKGQLNFILSKFLSESIVEDLMMEKIATIRENANVQDAAKLMLDRHVTHIPVVTDDYKLIGIITSWDLSKAIATDSYHLKDIMTTTVKYCNASETIEDVARKMRKFDISCLPVVDGDMKVLGLITTDQISNLLS
jgi:homoserine O-acetyltransferase